MLYGSYMSQEHLFKRVFLSNIIANDNFFTAFTIVPIIFSNNLKLWCHYFDWHAQVVSEGLFTRTMALAPLIDSDRIARQCLSVYRRTYHKYLMTDWYWIMQQKFQVFSFDWNVVSIEVWLEFESKQTGDHYCTYTICPDIIIQSDDEDLIRAMVIAEEGGKHGKTLRPQ